TGERKGRGRRGRRGGRGRNRDRDRDRGERPAPSFEPGNETEMPQGEPQLAPMDNHPPADGEEHNRGRRPRGRRGRGRRRWRDPDERGERPEGGRNEWHEPNHNALPAFATEAPVTPPPPPRAPEPVVEITTLESTPRDPNVPAKKGWWQKMIELDE